MLDKGTGQVPIATIYHGRAFINTVMPYAERGSPEFLDQMMCMTDHRSMIVPPYGSRDFEMTVESTIDPESGHDLSAMGSALSKGRHLVSEHASIMVPLKTTAIVVFAGDGQAATVHFRGPEQYADYLAGVLTLPEVEQTSAQAWIAEQLAANAEYGSGATEIVMGSLFNSLDYTAVMASRGHAVGWRLDPNSLEMLRVFAQHLPEEQHQQIRESVLGKLQADPAGRDAAKEILRNIGV
jgi:hypothetical protein